MTELEAKVAELQKAESDLQTKKSELEKANLDIEEKNRQKTALDLEVSRVQKEIADAKASRRSEEGTFQDKLRTENQNVALQKVVSELGIKSEDQAKFLEGFKTDSVSVDGIASDMRRKYANDHAEELLAVKRKADELSAGSDVIKAQFSSAAFGGTGSEVKNQDQGLDPEELEAARYSGMSPARMLELKQKGKLE